MWRIAPGLRRGSILRRTLPLVHRVAHSLFHLSMSLASAPAFNPLLMGALAFLVPIADKLDEVIAALGGVQAGPSAGSIPQSLFGAAEHGDAGAGLGGAVRVAGELQRCDTGGECRPIPVRGGLAERLAAGAVGGAVVRAVGFEPASRRQLDGEFEGRGAEADFRILEEAGAE